MPSPEHRATCGGCGLVCDDIRLNRIGAGTDEIMLEVIGRSYGL